MDREDWGSSFGSDPDWAEKKIKSLEERIKKALNHIGWAKAQVDRSDLFNCLDKAIEVLKGG